MVPCLVCLKTTNAWNGSKQTKGQGLLQHPDCCLGSSRAKHATFLLSPFPCLLDPNCAAGGLRPQYPRSTSAARLSLTRPSLGKHNLISTALTLIPLSPPTVLTPSQSTTARAFERRTTTERYTTTAMGIHVNVVIRAPIWHVQLDGNDVFAGQAAVG